jgi:hypothetical protein
MRKYMDQFKFGLIIMAIASLVALAGECFGQSQHDPMYPSPIIQEPIQSIDMQLEKFRKERTVAKTIQLIGAMALTGATILAYSKRAPENAKNIKYLQIGGTSALSVGLILDLSAGQLLKRRR